jgi:hypothetical protein
MVELEDSRSEGRPFHLENVLLEELSVEELEASVKAGLFYKAKAHKEHFAIDPFWLAEPKKGLLQELTKTLGKWNQK